MSDRVRAVYAWIVRHPAQCLLVVGAALVSTWLATHVSVLGEIPQGHFSWNIRREIELDYATGLLWWAEISECLTEVPSFFKGQTHAVTNF